MSEPVSTREAAGSVPVSTQCPNCGSDGRRLEDRRVPYLCGVVSWVDADKKVIVSKETEACSLIRSLRNERDTLAAAINATSIPTRRECPGPCGDSDVCGCYWTGYRFAHDHFEPVETKEAFEAGFEQGRDAERDAIAADIKRMEMSPGAHDCLSPKDSATYRDPDHCRGCLLLMIVSRLRGNEHRSEA